MDGPYFKVNNDIFFNADFLSVNANSRRPTSRFVTETSEKMAVCWSKNDRLLLKHGALTNVWSWLERYRTTLQGAIGELAREDILLVEFNADAKAIEILNQIICEKNPGENLFLKLGVKDSVDFKHD